MADLFKVLLIYVPAAGNYCTDEVNNSLVFGNRGVNKFMSSLFVHILMTVGL